MLHWFLFISTNSTLLTSNIASHTTNYSSLLWGLTAGYSDSFFLHGKGSQSFLSPAILYLPTIYFNQVWTTIVGNKCVEAAHKHYNKINMYHREKFWLVFPYLHHLSSHMKIAISYHKVIYWFRKGRGTRDQTANICWIIGKKTGEFQKNIYFCFMDYAKAFYYVDRNKLWKILQEIGMPDHLTCLLRNLCAGKEVTARTGHGTMGWFQIGKGVC